MVEYLPPLYFHGFYFECYHVCRIDFIVGHEIEFGGIYQGVVTSIKGVYMDLLWSLMARHVIWTPKK